jgi:hypothetical protein
VCCCPQPLGLSVKKAARQLGGELAGVRELKTQRREMLRQEEEKTWAGPAIQLRHIRLAVYATSSCGHVVTPGVARPGKVFSVPHWRHSNTRLTYPFMPGSTRCKNSSDVHFGQACQPFYTPYGSIPTERSGKGAGVPRALE